MGIVNRLSAPSLVAAAAVLAALVAMPGALHARAQDTLTLDSSVVNASWKESWLTGNVAFTGTVSAQSELNAFLRRLEPGPRVVIARTVLQAAPGTFAGTLQLPNRALPGSYLLRITGVSGGVDLTPVEATLTLPAPEEGIVDKAVVSRTSGGKAVRRVRGPVRQLFARFHFVVPPEDVESVRLVWRTPQFNFVGEVRKPYRPTVETFIKSGRPLPKGTWYCSLTVNGIVTKRVLVRIT